MENQASLDGITNGNSEEKEPRRRSPLEKELSSTKRVVQILEELEPNARARVLAHVSAYISSMQPTEQEELPL